MVDRIVSALDAPSVRWVVWLVGVALCVVELVRLSLWIAEPPIPTPSAAGLPEVVPGSCPEPCELAVPDADLWRAADGTLYRTIEY